MNRAHCKHMMRRLALVVVLAAAVGGPAAAQEATQVTVAVRGGLTSYDRSASLDRAPVIGLDAMYSVNDWLSIGPTLSLGRPQSTGKDFISFLPYGVLNLGDTTSFFKSTQPVSVLDGALNAKVQLPGRRLAPYVTGGIGGYAMFMDVQTMRGEKHKVGMSFNVGAGVSYSLSDRAGLTFDVRSVTFTDYDRNVLDPRMQCAITVPTNSPCGRIEYSIYYEDFPQPPKNKSTVTNFVFGLGFTYVPRFFGSDVGGGQ
jgi:opacity protein-like surface antigen